MKQIRNSLGIVFYERTIAVAEIIRTGDACQVRRSAEFGIPEGITIEDIASQQSAFEAFLKEQGFKAQKAVVGISAKQIVSTPLKIPPIEDAVTRQETIKIQLERKLEMDFSDIVFDCWDRGAGSTGSTLAFITLKKTVIEIKAFLAACKITPVWITASSVGLDLATTTGLDCHIICYPTSLEVFVFQDGNPMTVLNISRKAKEVFDAELADEVSRQIKRALWSLPNKADQTNYSVWTTQREAASVKQQLSRTLGNVQQINIKGPAGTGSVSAFCDVAAQLGSRLVSGDAVGINFLNGHHQAKATMIPKQWQSRIAICAAGVLLLLGLYFYGWYSDSVLISQYEQNIKNMSNNVTSAEQMINRVNYARQWFNRKPVHLENLRELTLVFPMNSDIWLTSLAVDPSLTQVIAGRATHDEVILDVVDRLKANPAFEDINLQYTRKMGRNTDLITFAVKFKYQGEQ